MGDEHHCTAVVGEKRFEPRDGLDIEVVRRLVEQQQVRLTDERARQQHTTAPSAGQRIDNRVRRQLQPGQHEIHMMLAEPLVVFVEVMRVPFGDNREDRPVGRKRDVLFEAGNSQGRLPPRGPGVGRELTADDLQQRRLAAAVTPKDRNALLRLDLEHRVFEQWQMAKRDRHAVEREQRHRES